MMTTYLIRNFILAVFTLLVFSTMTAAQTTEFTYQGSLQNSSVPATGNYDFEFLLFDAVSGGAQIGSTLTRSSVAVANGDFSVKLDFGSQFPGANRYLEIRVKQTGGGGAFTPLTPRQAVNSAPYSVKSLNTDQLGGVAANQYVTTTGGGANFIQNQNAGFQSANFTIIGVGTAVTFRAESQYNIQGDRVLSVGNSGVTKNIYVGVGAGSGQSPPLTQGGNSFFGTNSGFANITGSGNVFVGLNAGRENTSGNSNTFLGANSGISNTSESNNTFVGNQADGATAITNATAIGYQAKVTQNNSLVLGSINGINGATASTNVGIGTTAPNYKLHVVGENIRLEGNTTNTLPRFSLNFTGGAADEKKWQNYASPGALIFSALNDAENAESIWLRVNRGPGTAISSVVFSSGLVAINNLGVAGVTALCYNASNQISTCSSSARYKNNINTFSSGLDLIRKLRPVTFNWKDGGMADMGLVAEEVNAVEPLLTTTNASGQVEGVKYDRVGVVLVNAVKEQQAQIEAQQRQIEQQRMEIDALKALVCSQNPSAELCRPKN